MNYFFTRNRVCSNNFLFNLEIYTLFNRFETFGLEREINWLSSFLWAKFQRQLRLESYHLHASDSLPHNALSCTEGQSDFQLYLANVVINGCTLRHKK